MVRKGRINCATRVADYLILNSKEHLTPLHINKLAFFSHGWVLGSLHRPLVAEVVQAWKYGPVFPSIYHSFKHYSTDRIDPNAHISLDIQKYKELVDDIFDDDEKNVMGQVIDTYSELSGSELIKITHEKGSPWHQCYDRNKFFVEIPNHIIQDYYTSEA